MAALPAPAGTQALCGACGMAVFHKNRTLGWQHAILGQGTDHAPAPQGWMGEAATPAAERPGRALTLNRPGPSTPEAAAEAFDGLLSTVFGGTRRPVLEAVR